MRVIELSDKAACSRRRRRLAAVLLGAVAPGTLLASGSVDPSQQGLEGAGTAIPVVSVAFQLFGADRETALDRLAAAGVKAIRQDFLWQRIEPAPGVYDFSYEDDLVAAAAAHGIEVLAILAYGNPLYSRIGMAAQQVGLGGGVPPFGIGATYLYPPDAENLPAYRRFARATAAHFAGRVNRWEIWNEENVGWRFWPPHEDPAAYGALLEEAAAGLREGNPAAVVSLGGLFYPEIPPGLPEQGALRYLGNVYDANPHVGASIDAVAWHPYPYPFIAPEVVLPANSSVAGSADEIRSFLAGRGEEKQLWVTEAGWPTHVEYGVTREKQAAYLVRSFAAFWAQGVRLVTWYCYADGPAADHNQEDAFGLVAADGTMKPAYDALRTFTTLLGDAVLAGMRRDLGDVQAFVFESPTRRITLLWTTPETLFSDYGPLADTAGETEVSLPVSTPSVTVVSTTGQSRALNQSAGVVHVTASAFPVYVVESF
jgi:hypothetical protein